MAQGAVNLWFKAHDVVHLPITRPLLIAYTPECVNVCFRPKVYGALKLASRCSMTVHDIIKDALITVAILNLVVSVAVARSSALSGRQKILQILVIWVVPVVGGVLFGLFMLTQRGNAPRTGYPSERSEDVSRIWSGLHPPDQKH